MKIRAALMALAMMLGVAGANVAGGTPAEAQRYHRGYGHGYDRGHPHRSYGYDRGHHGRGRGYDGRGHRGHDRGRGYDRHRGSRY